MLVLLYLYKVFEKKIESLLFFYCNQMPDLKIKDISIVYILSAFLILNCGNTHWILGQSG